MMDHQQKTFMSRHGSQFVLTRCHALVSGSISLKINEGEADCPRLPWAHVDCITLDTVIVINFVIGPVLLFFILAVNNRVEIALQVMSWPRTR